MKWQDVLKWSGGGSVSIFLLLALLTNLSGISNVQYSPDQFCTTECEAYINFTTRYWEFCFEHSGDKDIVYKKMTYSRRLWINLDRIDEVVDSDPRVHIDVQVPTYGKSWRDIKDGDCLRRTTNSNPLPVRLKLVGQKDYNQTVKWSFMLDSQLSQRIEIDPVWVGYSDIYDKKLVYEPVYADVNVTHEAVCYEDNKSCYDEYVSTEFKLLRYEYRNVSFKVDGVKIGDEEYRGRYKVCDGSLVKYNYPVGDRNYDEFCHCLPHELEKGTCVEEVIKI